MSALLASVHAIGLLTCFALLGTSRIGACIRWLSLQGIVFGLVPLIAHDDGIGLRVMLLAGGNIALKGIIFPWVLLRLRARTLYPREVEPFVGFVASILFGIVALGLSVWLALELKPSLPHAPFLMLETAIFVVSIGLFMIISRRSALMQVIGYLMLETAFSFSASSPSSTPRCSSSWGCCSMPSSRFSSWGSRYSTSTASSGRWMSISSTR